MVTDRPTVKSGLEKKIFYADHLSSIKRWRIQATDCQNRNHDDDWSNSKIGPRPTAMERHQFYWCKSWASYHGGLHTEDSCQNKRSLGRIDPQSGSSCLPFVRSSFFFVELTRSVHPFFFRGECCVVRSSSKVLRLLQIILFDRVIK